MRTLRLWYCRFFGHDWHIRSHAGSVEECGCCHRMRYGATRRRARWNDPR